MHPSDRPLSKHSPAKQQAAAQKISDWRLVVRKVLSLALSLTVAFALVHPLPASAAPRSSAHAKIDRIEEFMAEAEFEQALELVKAELAKSDLSDDDTGRLYELQGTLHLYLADEEAARNSFRMLLQTSPDYELQPKASPKVRELFEQAREKIVQELSANLKLRHPRPAPAEPGAPIRVEIIMENAPENVRAKLYYRRSAKTRFSDTRFVESKKEENRWVATVPGMDFGDSEPAGESKRALEYFIQVLGPADTLVAVAGRADAPLSIPFASGEGGQDAEGVAEDNSSHWYKKWWVWTIVGVVVAGAVTGGVIYALSDQTGKVPINVSVIE